MTGGLLASMEAAAGLAVFGGSAASMRRELVAAGIPGLLASKDPTLWGSSAEANARGRLGWVDGYRRSRTLLPQLAELCQELADLDEVVVGAPATAASAITRSLGVPLTVLDSDPPRLCDAIADPDRLQRTVVVLTDGADHLRDTFWAAYAESGLTDAETSRHFVTVTVPGSNLEASARHLGLMTLAADPGAAGAFGALTATALVPAALAGVDVAELLDEAELLAPSLAGDTDNPALALGAALASHQTFGAIPMHPQTPAGLIALVNDGTGFEGLGDWAAELLAAAGVRAVAVDDPGSHDRSTSGVMTISYGGALGVASVPGGGSQPDIAVNGPLGAQFLTWQYAVALAAAARGTNPFSNR